MPRQRQATATRSTGTRAQSQTSRSSRPTPKAQVAVVADETAANLNKIDHVVVLMLENRSFDHMLGYLSLEQGRTDIDGLKAGMANRHAGKRYPIHHLKRTALTKADDPCHGGACVAQQVSNDMGGFVDNFVEQRPQADDKGIVMGYYSGADLPV